MKLITLTANNRPGYTAQLLDSLRRCNTAGYKLLCFLEPNCVENEVLCKAVDFMPCEVFVNEHRMGVRGNPYQALKYAFEELKADSVVYLEDDIELAPDALDLCNFYFDHPECRDAVSLQLFSYHSYPGNRMEVAGPWNESLVSRVCLGVNGLFPHFSALGLGISRQSWQQHFEPQWWIHPSGWDWSIESYLLSEYAFGRELLMAQPIVARANHTGRLGGTHCQPDFHDRMFSRIHLHEGPAPQYTLERFAWGPAQRPDSLGGF